MHTVFYWMKQDKFFSLKLEKYRKLKFSGSYISKQKTFFFTEYTILCNYLPVNKLS